MAEKLKFRPRRGYLLVEGDVVVVAGAGCVAKIDDRVETTSGGIPLKVDGRDYRVLKDGEVQVVKNNEE